MFLSHIDAIKTYLQVWTEKHSVKFSKKYILTNIQRTVFEKTCGLCACVYVGGGGRRGKGRSGYQSERNILLKFTCA